MACYTFSVWSIIPQSETLKIAMKKIDEEENERLAKKSISTLKDLIFGGEKHFEKVF